MKLILQINLFRKLGGYNPPTFRILKSVIARKIYCKKRLYVIKSNSEIVCSDKGDTNEKVHLQTIMEINDR